MMPNLLTTLHGFEETLQFQLVAKTVVDHDLVEGSLVKPALFCEGVLQPLHPRELLVKPEGERHFKWWTLFTDLELDPDQILKDEDGKSYRVMSTTSWAQGGFTAYQVIEGVGV